MIGRRVRPLLALALVGTAVVLLRLWRVQVHEHALWAREADLLVHSGSVLPYERGRILDADGRVLARDTRAYEVALVYREFRRGHPLGQVAHARSLLEGRAVPLEEARERLPVWASELVGLTPRVLDAFGDGEAIEAGSTALPAAGEAERAYRPRRAADVRYYLQRLLDLEPRVWRRVARRAREAPDRSYLELAAAELDTTSHHLAARLEARLARTLDALARLAELRGTSGSDEPVPLGAPGAPGAPGRSGATGDAASLDELLGLLEETRRRVEDATASKLFAEATGFAPGRLEARTLDERFDLSWIRGILAWDPARLAEWTAATRAGWLAGWRDGYALPHLAASLRLDPAREVGPDDVLDAVAAVFLPEGAVEAVLDGHPASWREAGALAVLDGLGETFGLDVPAVDAPLPFLREDVRAFHPAESARWTLIDRALAVLPDEPTLGEAMRTSLAGSTRRATETFDGLVGVLADDWERALQARVREALEAATGAARAAGELGPAGQLGIRAELRERAVERADYFQKDYGNRPRMLFGGEPDYAVVWLLTRYADAYPGFEVREASRREQPFLEGDAEPLFDGLLGRVSAAGVDELHAQRQDARRLRELRDLPERTRDEELEMRELLGVVMRPDEVQGVSGVEGFWDLELRGRNGYREDWGLQEHVEEQARASVAEPVDGRDVVLTLDADLQRAAQDVLSHPVAVPDDPEFDWAWHDAPVGAIVLLDVQGDVLAAASEPHAASEVDPDAAGQRALVIERTLRQPTFQPPGSVFKPFVAAYALDRYGLDPHWTVECGPIERGGYGYVDVRCWRSSGHGEVDLYGALVGSCNAYFAALGERYRIEDLFEMARLFGFGEPTGVRTPPPWDDGLVRRGGLLEAVPDVFRTRDGRFGPFQKRLAGNGLAVLDATPMQVARATLALATGRLAPLRLVERIGRRDVPRLPAERVPLSEASLAFVRHALSDVTASTAGTAHRALDPAALGFAVAAKTGSADLTSRRDDEGIVRARKHTWVAGWTPVDAPELVFVVFVHDTSATSSHGAAYLARQLLGEGALRQWLVERGVAVGEPHR